MKTVILFLLVFFQMALAGSVFSADNVYSESFALPVSEAVYRVEKWLKSNGFVTEQVRLKNGTVRITTSGNDSSEAVWSVDLVSQSTLGTEVTVATGQDPQADTSVGDLFEALRYEGTNFQNSIAETPNAIPGPVLEQSGNVACIYVKTKNRSLQFSGFFIDKEGLILSTAHDLREQEGVKIKTNGGRLYEGNIIKTDFERDLALIEVTAQKDGIVSVSEGRNLLAIGEQIYTIGCPINLRGTVHQGFINGPPRSYHESPIWQVQMDIQPGSSGSPAFDSRGQLVGLIKGRHREAGDIGFLIPLEIVMDFLKENLSQ